LFISSRTAMRGWIVAMSVTGMRFMPVRSKASMNGAAGLDPVG